ncbi:MAG: cutinase family protein [Mycobacterium sp.]
MSPRRISSLIGAAAAVTWAIAPWTLQATSLPSAHAADCPDALAIFARGTTEDPGNGFVGDAFVHTLRAQVAPKTLDVYSVDYPATTDFPTAVDGIRDARTHITATAVSCPKTKMVLGGFSQGAAVMGFVTAGTIPDGVSASDVPAPMPPDVAPHVSAVVLFGKPSPRFMRAINDPPVTVGPLYQIKTKEMCEDDDVVCDPHGTSFDAHNSYIDTGMVTQGVNFAVSQLQAGWAADALTPSSSTPPPPPAAISPAAGSTNPVGPAQHLPPTAPALPGTPNPASQPPPGPPPAT